MDEKLHNLIDRMAVQHVCTRPNVLDVVSKWLSMHKNGEDDLKDVLEIYGGLRDLGYPHEEIIHSLKYMHSLWFLMELQRKPNQYRKLPEFRLVRED